MAITNLDQVQTSGVAGFIGGSVEIPVVISGDGAITIAPSIVALTKGSAAAITIAVPTAGSPVTGGHDGFTILVYTETAFAHVITQGTDGFNAKGSSGTVTLVATKGCGVLLTARNGHWWVATQTGSYAIA